MIAPINITIKTPLESRPSHKVALPTVSDNIIEPNILMAPITDLKFSSLRALAIINPETKQVRKTNKISNQLPFNNKLSL